MVSTQSITESSKTSNSITSRKEENTNYTSTYDEDDHENPSSKAMEAINGRGYQLLKQLGYNGKGCGVKEQGICVPIEPNTQETTKGHGYYPSKITKTSKILSLNSISCFSLSCHSCSIT